MTTKKLPSELLSFLEIKTGIECEGIRVTTRGEIAKTPHPSVFGDKLENPYITVDYAEQQTEIITPPSSSAHETYMFARALRRIVNLECKKNDELLWPQSLPCGLPGNPEDIEVARYSDTKKGRAAHAYREALGVKYGKARQMLSGVHYNFSFDNRLLDAFGGSSVAYMKVARNFLRYGWLLVYLTGATPRNEVISVRNSDCGYCNPITLCPDYSTLENYIESIERFIDRGDIAEAKELYSKIRIKPHDVENLLDSLRKDGVSYLEIRALDLNPFDEAGIAEYDLDFLHAFVLYLLLADEDFSSDEYQVTGDDNISTVAGRGLAPHLALSRDGQEVSMRIWAQDILSDMRTMAQGLSLGYDVYSAIEMAIARVLEPRLTYAYQYKKLAEESSCIEAGMQLAFEHRQAAFDERWLTSGFEEWEMSTQLLIKEALTRGIRVESLDKDDNIIRLSTSNRTEYVEQCTKTSADSYITPLLMNNKSVTKIMLSEAGIRVPAGAEFDEEHARAALRNYVGLPCVVKPKSTNFGLGVIMFPKGTSLVHLLEAAGSAFGYDRTVLVEEFIEGPEYRFLVIDGAVAGVLQRSPAQVEGDGKSTIAELVERKNEHPYRSTGYKTPLINITLSSVEIEFLARRGLTPASVPFAGDTVFLRSNSNISTGGDSIDMTDAVSPIFKDIAVSASRVFDAVFCGIDMIIADCTNSESAYAIIEANFNPAIHIHSFPAVGEERNIARLVLDAIGF
ncbi:MAG: bifunctional glutamate--cysteine ligase GshA/glutathione synthetase GshB [Coriobacteriia bacterium]|nr:bifunctional glutamate--cysteine ligase GshA/glutathione synthetase GshB [Coriobacteriia bacterium]